MEKVKNGEITEEWYSLPSYPLQNLKEIAIKNYLSNRFKYTVNIKENFK